MKRTRKRGNPNLREHAGLPLSSEVAAVFLEKVVELLMLGVLASVAVVGVLVRHNTPVVWMALAALLIIGGLPWLGPHATRLAVQVAFQQLRRSFGRFVEYSAE